MDRCSNGGGAAEASPFVAPSSSSSILRGDRRRASRRKHSELCPTHSWKSIYKQHQCRLSVGVNRRTNDPQQKDLFPSSSLTLPFIFLSHVDVYSSSQCPLQSLPSGQVGCSRQSALGPVHHSGARCPGRVQAPSEAPQTRSWSRYQSQSLEGRWVGVKDI